ncbi:LOW QUALITY PROTEIN: proton-coupled zinc antiporter SLC30A2 [Sarcophilus harrisii]
MDCSGGPDVVPSLGAVPDELTKRDFPYRHPPAPGTTFPKAAVLAVSRSLQLSSRLSTGPGGVHTAALGAVRRSLQPVPLHLTSPTPPPHTTPPPAGLCTRRAGCRGFASSSPLGTAAARSCGGDSQLGDAGSVLSELAHSRDPPGGQGTHTRTRRTFPVGLLGRTSGAPRVASGSKGMEPTEKRYLLDVKTGACWCQVSRIRRSALHHPHAPRVLPPVGEARAQLIKRESDQKLPEGLGRILGVLLSVLSICWVVTGVLVYLAVQRLISGDYEIGEAMLITSGRAVAVNIIMGFTLHQSDHGHWHSHGHSHGTNVKKEEQNLSVRAAFIHVVGDLLQSLGVLVVAHVLYYKPEYKYVDPICTFLFSILVLTTLTILRDVIQRMEATPKGVDFTAVRDLLLSVEGVASLHSLHIWALTVAQPVLSVHIAIAQEADAQAVLKEARSRLQGMFHFHTTTIQIEDYSEDMRDCQECQGPSD